MCQMLGQHSYRSPVFMLNDVVTYHWALRWVSPTWFSPSLPLADLLFKITFCLTCFPS